MEMPTFPDNLNAAYQVALRQAWDALSAAGPKLIAQNSGAQLSGQGWQLSLLEQEYHVDLTSRLVHNPTLGTPASIYESLIILHYLKTAQAIPQSGEWLPYRDLPGGQVYYSNFLKRVNRPLLRAMDKAPADFFRKLALFPGQPASQGDFCYILQALPRVPIQLIYWQGDSELPSELSVLYDRTATRQLSLEDLVVMAELLAYRIIRAISYSTSQS